MVFVPPNCLCTVHIPASKAVSRHHVFAILCRLVADEGVAVLLLLEVLLFAGLSLGGDHVVAVAALGSLVKLDGSADEDVGDVAALGAGVDGLESTLSLADGEAVVDVVGVLLLGAGDVLLLEALVADGLVVAAEVLLAVLRSGAVAGSSVAVVAARAVAGSVAVAASIARTVTRAVTASVARSVAIARAVARAGAVTIATVVRSVARSVTRSVAVTVASVVGAVAASIARSVAVTTVVGTIAIASIVGAVAVAAVVAAVAIAVLTILVLGSGQDIEIDSSLIIISLATNVKVQEIFKVQAIFAQETVQKFRHNAILAQKAIQETAALVGRDIDIDGGLVGVLLAADVDVNKAVAASGVGRDIDIDSSLIGILLATDIDIDEAVGSALEVDERLAVEIKSEKTIRAEEVKVSQRRLAILVLAEVEIDEAILAADLEISQGAVLADVETKERINSHAILVLIDVLTLRKLASDVEVLLKILLAEKTEKNKHLNVVDDSVLLAHLLRNLVAVVGAASSAVVDRLLRSGSDSDVLVLGLDLVGLLGDDVESRADAQVDEGRDVEEATGLTADDLELGNDVGRHLEIKKL